MRYTSLWSHMEEESPLQIGELVYPGDYIGRMGNSGKSTANHCHLGLIKGMRSSLFHMRDVELSDEIVLQLSYFLEDDMIFKAKTVITSYIGDPAYRKFFGLIHKGYDIVPENRHTAPGKNFNMYWPRTKIGQVMDTGYDDNGYGNYALIAYNS